MFNTNDTPVTTKMQAPVWMLDLTGTLVETEAHDAVVMPARDRDGKFAPKFEAPVSKAKAWKKLQASTAKARAAQERFCAFE